MSNTASIAVRVDKDLKECATSILEGLGVDLSTAIRMYLSQIVIKEAMPFEVSYDSKTHGFPNEDTMAALDWAKEYKKKSKKSGFKNTKDLYKHLEM